MHTGVVSTVGSDELQGKRTRILDAAEHAFSAYGVARSAMADIASGADMSRPALYQHFANKEEIYAAVLERLLTTAADAAVAELHNTDLELALDGFLQRWTGDLTERFRSTQHGADLVEAKQGHAQAVIATVRAQVRAAVEARLATDAQPEAVATLTELLLLSPAGLKADDPPLDVLRTRLSGLADAVAATAR